MSDPNIPGPTPITDEEEFRSFRQRLDEWSRSLPFAVTRKLGEESRILSASMHHAYPFRIETKYAVREFTLEEGGIPDADPTPIECIEMWRIPGAPTTGNFKKPVPGTCFASACDECDGRGEVTCPECNGGHMVNCPKCGGSGFVDGRSCGKCGRRGVIVCEKCNGRGIVECSRCDGSGIITRQYYVIQKEKEDVDEAVWGDEDMPVLGDFGDYKDRPSHLLYAAHSDRNKSLDRNGLTGVPVHFKGELKALWKAHTGKHLGDEQYIQSQDVTFREVDDLVRCAYEYKGETHEVWLEVAGTGVHEARETGLMAEWGEKVAEEARRTQWRDPQKSVHLYAKACAITEHNREYASAIRKTLCITSWLFRGAAFLAGGPWWAAFAAAHGGSPAAGWGMLGALVLLDVLFEQRWIWCQLGGAGALWAIVAWLFPACFPGQGEPDLLVRVQLGTAALSFTGLSLLLARDFALRSAGNWVAFAATGSLAGWMTAPGDPGLWGADPVKTMQLGLWIAWGLLGLAALRTWHRCLVQNAGRNARTGPAWLLRFEIDSMKPSIWRLGVALLLLAAGVGIWRTSVHPVASPDQQTASAVGLFDIAGGEWRNIAHDRIESLSAAGHPLALAVKAYGLHEGLYGYDRDVPEAFRCAERAAAEGLSADTPEGTVPALEKPLLFALALEQIRSHYGKTEDATGDHLLEEAMGGTLRCLFPGKEAVPSSFGGIGIRTAIRNRQFTILSAEKDMPAARAGILAGDTLLEIDGESTEGMTMETATGKLRGDSGTTLSVKVFRPRTEETLAFTMERAAVNLSAAAGIGTLAELADAWKAAGEGDDCARILLAGCYEKGGFPAQDLRLARFWMLKAADSGLLSSQKQAAGWLEKGRGGPAKPARALAYLEKAAEQGDVDSMGAAGIMHFNGTAGHTDFWKAAYWLQRASDAGDGTASFNLGVCYSTGKGVVQDARRAFECHKLAAERGVPIGNLLLGLDYESGTGVDVDYVAARDAYVRAGEAQWEKAGLARGRAQELAEIARCWERARDGEDADAQYQVGICLAEGHGVDRNPEAAFPWFEKAASRDHLGAIVRMADALYAGNGVKEDKTSAVKAYLRAARAGDAHSMMRLGEAFEVGSGVRKDLAIAFAFYSKAARTGAAGAEEAARRIEIPARQWKTGQKTAN